MFSMKLALTGLLFFCVFCMLFCGEIQYPKDESWRLLAGFLILVSVLCFLFGGLVTIWTW